ncbi:hypothetical protein [Clostridium gasigenes]|uniref:DNA-binding ferritin-like protein (Dps family) n=1 Tax=Clostridium gasigenes TaxID=94869 RepID=A0A1H0Q451_9CLOT|nr:hypothetical protein [Clostridium gasigenes]MBB6623280.1 hypothetical protein [Clostridium gasigenes]MBB6713311.1 hypothetical protein [Clostridium gasigenes]MBU3088091.1 hypothetical protein [Clostridium gasigenes]SDP12182.1 hypothetical protein SAMN04488529_102201 [Clostridium gasigenes]
MKKNLNKSEFELKGEYKDTYLDIVIYLSGSNLNDSFVTEVSEDLKDLFITAQEEGRGIKEIVGKNIEIFCKDIINSNKSKKVRLFNIIKNLNWSLFMGAILSILFYIFNEELSLNTIVLFIFNFFIVPYIVKVPLRKLVFKYKGNIRKIVSIVIFTLLLIIPTAIINFIIIIQFVPVVNVNGLYSGVIILFIIGIIHIITKYKIKEINWKSYFWGI